MLEVSLTDFRRQFRRYRALAGNALLALTDHGRVVGYFVSPAEFEQFQVMQRMASRSFAIADLSETEMEEIASGKMSSQHAALDDLLD